MSERMHERMCERKERLTGRTCKVETKNEEYERVTKRRRNNVDERKKERESENDKERNKMISSTSQSGEKHY